MNGIKTTTTNTTILSIKKFETLIVVENGVILVKKKKRKTTILFSELNKIYIEKHKFSLLNKIGLLTIFLILTALCSIFIPNELILASLILIIPLIIKINKYKWYQLNILLYDGTLNKKVFYNHKKQEYINRVNTIKQKVYYYRIDSKVHLKKTFELNTIVADYADQAIGIA